MRGVDKGAFPARLMSLRTQRTHGTAGQCKDSLACGRALRLIGAGGAWRIPLTQMVGGVGSEAGKISGAGEAQVWNTGHSQYLLTDGVFSIQWGNHLEF